MFADGVLDIVIPDTINFRFFLASRVDQESRYNREFKFLSQTSGKEFFVALPETDSNLRVIVVKPQSLVIWHDSFTRTAPV